MERFITEEAMRFNLLSLLVLGLTVAPAFTTSAQQPVDGFLARNYKDSRGATMPYRLFIPRTYDPQQSYPLVVYLHGGGGSGGDNLQQILKGNASGSHVWASEHVQGEHPVFVLAPQAPEGATWGGPEASELSAAAREMLEIMESLEREFNIDKARLYLTGQSLGGFGTWDVIIRRPNLFAAAVPLCGSGIVPQYPFRKVYSSSEFSRIKEMPIWVFQGADDENVPAVGPRNTVDTLREIGSRVRYTEYGGVGHRVWEHAYLEPGLIDWVFAQHRAR